MSAPKSKRPAPPIPANLRGKPELPFDEPLTEQTPLIDALGPPFEDPPIANLFVESGPGANQLVPLAHGKLYIGRAASAGMRLDHPSISRQHAVVTRRGSRFFVEDLGSKNGTYVDDNRIENEVEIYPGSRLSIGASEIILRAPRRADPITRADDRRSKPLHPMAIALGSGAMGFVLAAALITAWPRSPLPPSAAPLQTQAPRKRLPNPPPAEAAIAPPSEARLEVLPARVNKPLPPISLPLEPARAAPVVVVHPTAVKRIRHRSARPSARSSVKLPDVEPATAEPSDDPRRAAIDAAFEGN